MMRMSELASAVNGTLIGEDVEFTSVGSDSRNLIRGQLFVALKGENFDGHAYVAQTIKDGTVGALVSVQQGTVPQVIVDDTKLALGALASYWRTKMAIPVIAITGSNGKTTVKEMLAAILANHTGDADKVLATQGNLNNDIGLPLTLLRLKPKHQYAVAEMGMNHAGEIRYLSHLAKPNVALVNNASAAHLGGLGSVEAIAMAKGEIFEGLVADGIAIINADDFYADYWRGVAKQHQQMTFGIEHTSDITANYQLRSDDSELELNTSKGVCTFTLPVAGLHNIKNALAATTLALAVGVSLNDIAEGLTKFNGVKGRLHHKRGINGATLIDDTYNANPASMKAAIDVLASKHGRKILVLGDMGELGDSAPILHAEVGQYAQQKGIDALYTLGNLSMEMSRAFSATPQHYSDANTLAEVLKNSMNENTNVLIKGSRFMKMEQVVALLQETPLQNNSEEKR